jgi:hypothetical protein
MIPTMLDEAALHASIDSLRESPEIPAADLRSGRQESYRLVIHS